MFDLTVVLILDVKLLLSPRVNSFHHVTSTTVNCASFGCFGIIPAKSSFIPNKNYISPINLVAQKMLCQFILVCVCRFCLQATFDCLMKTYGFLTPEFWDETKFAKTPFQEFTDLLAKPTKGLVIEAPVETVEA